MLYWETLWVYFKILNISTTTRQSGKYKNMLGAFECELVKNKKIKFTISGMNDSIRKNYKKTHSLGTIVTFTYIGLSSKGVPRHPVYLRIRN